MFILVTDKVNGKVTIKMNRSKNITLKEIADKVGVSKVTVSKALRDHSDISASKKELIKKQALKMGYIPNIAARNLSSNKTKTIGLIVPKIAHSFFATIIESVYKHAIANGYEVILTSSQENEKLEQKHITTMLSMKVDGILISLSRDTKDKNIFSVVDNHGVKLVQFDRTLNTNHSRVVFDNLDGSKEAIDKALKVGYKKFAFVGGNHKSHIGKERLAVVKKVLKSNGLSLDENFIVSGGFTEDDGYNAIRKFHKNDNLPEIIFAVTFPVALGVLRGANELGINIPKDIDIVSFGDSSYNSYITPKISSVYQDVEKMAELSVKKLIEEIECKEEIKYKTIKLKSIFLQKDTCRTI